MDNYLKKLEYDKLLNLLKDFAITNLGKEKCLNLTPSFDKDIVKNLLNQTDEAMNLSLRKGIPPISEIEDISLALKKLKSGNFLSNEELLNIANILKLSRQLKDYFYKDENFDISLFPIFSNLFSMFYTNLGIENEIFNSIIDNENVADSASSKLSSLRRNRKNLEAEIKDTLNKIIHSSSYSKYIMEQIITIRNDRFVIPIKEEYKGMIKGFVHDISSSGSTLFLEPMSIFEMNNSINNIKFEEALEIERILNSISMKLVPYIEELQIDVNAISNIDFIFAKSKFAKSYFGILPLINDERKINLIKAKHPLIDSKTVVPIDISIGENYSSLIITGPNTGGKTVSLKTVGLLTAMACSGLAIPADENSSLYVFDNIFVDIGDEQSIQESLSTFSGHMSKIIKISSKATSNSLILLDELCSGTDPIEGANLALAILEYFYNIGATSIVTTHYQEIKNFALVTNGFENASCEFDVEKLKPTYKLLIGIPGKSNAFAISKKLGLNEKILDRAKAFMNDEHVSVEELLKNIYDDKIEIEKQKEETSKNLNQIELLRKSLEKENAKKLAEHEDLLQKSKEEAKKIILSAKEDANFTLKELNEIYSQMKQFKDLNLDDLSDSQIAYIVRNSFNYDNIKKANELSSSLNKTLNSLSFENENNKLNNNSSNINLKELKPRNDG